MDGMNRIKWVVPIVMRATHSANDRAMPLRIASSRGDPVHPVHPVFQGARCTARSFGPPTFRLRISRILDTQHAGCTRCHGSVESCLAPLPGEAPRQSLNRPSNCPNSPVPPSYPPPP
jgi:hypothetical protein